MAARGIALVLVAALAALAVHQENVRLRTAYEARRLVERKGEIENEVAWLLARRERLLSPAVFLPRSRKLGLGDDGPPGATIRAPEEVTDDPGH